MKPEIKRQKDLMEYALLVLKQIEWTTALFTGLDNDYLKTRVQLLEIEYAKAMSELAGELVKLAKPITNNKTQY